MLSVPMSMYAFASGLDIQLVSVLLILNDTAPLLWSMFCSSTYLCRWVSVQWRERRRSSQYVSVSVSSSPMHVHAMSLAASHLAMLQRVRVQWEHCAEDSGASAPLGSSERASSEGWRVGRCRRTVASE